MSASKVVLITGTSSGLGRATAQFLARKGHTVFATMRGVGGKNAAAAAELRAWTDAENLNLYVVELDLLDSDSVLSAVQCVIETAGQIDVLINNAGWGIFGLMESFTIEQAKRMFDTNVFGTMQVTQAVLPYMREQRDGLIVYLSSATTIIPYPFMSMYGASKAAVEAMAMGFNSEIYSLGIDTVIIQAGSYGTDFGKNVETSAREDIWDAYGPMGQAGKGMIAGLEDYFKSDMASPAESLGEAIAEYIDLPSGQRPLKVGLGFGSDGFDAVNSTARAIQTQAFEMTGFASFLAR